MAVARAPVAGVCDAGCDPDGARILRLPAAAKRSAPVGAVRGLDGIRLLAAATTGEGTAARDRRDCAARQVISASVWHRWHFPELAGGDRQSSAMVRRVLHHGPYDVPDGQAAHDRAGLASPREILLPARGPEA